MPFDIATITYEQWSEINRTLAGVHLELNHCRLNGETPMESKSRRKKEIRDAQNILSDIHKSTEDYCSCCGFIHRSTEEKTVSVVWDGVI